MPLLVLCSCTSDTVPPDILELTPKSGADLVGAGTVIVNALVREDGGNVDVEVFDNDELIGGYRDGGCDEVCAFAITWDTKTVPAGRHELRLQATDDAGNVNAKLHAVTIDDVVKVTSMELTNVTDESGTLEIEVYAFDATTRALVGCASGRDGLSPVDVAGVRYPLDATLLTVNNLPLGGLAFADRPVTFEVWEDDDSLQCPSVPSPTGNQLVGTSPAMTARDLAAQQPMMFGSVASITVELSRPLTLSDTPKPPSRPPPIDEDPDDNWGGGGAGCSAHRSSGASLVLALAALLGVSVRRRRS